MAAVMVQSDSAHWREKGNEKYRSADDNLSPALRISKLQVAINFYQHALSTARNDHEKSSACKNIAVAQWKTAKVSMAEGVTGRDVSFYFKEALKHFKDAKEYGKDRDPQWHDALAALCCDCWNSLRERVAEWGCEQRIDELEKLVAFHIDGPTMAQEYIEIANHYFHWSVTALGERDYCQCLRLLGKVNFPLNEAQRLGRGCPGLMQECKVLEEDIFIQHCVASSIQARVRGEDLLQEVLLDEEDLNMDMVWNIVDWFREAIRLTREQDLELEAMALSALGKVYDKVLKMEERAKPCLMKALELANSMVYRYFKGQDWYDFARSTVERYQLEQKTAEEEEEEKQHQANLHLIKEEMEVLKAKEASLGRAEFLKFLYNTYPPRNPKHTLAEGVSAGVSACVRRERVRDIQQLTISSTPEWTELKKLYQKAVVHYHPDKVQEEEHGLKWKTLTGEITKILARQYEFYKGSTRVFCKDDDS